MHKYNYEAHATHPLYNLKIINKLRLSIGIYLHLEVRVYTR